jgi:hypothetical protein
VFDPEHSRHPIACPGCGGQREIVIVVDLTAVEQRLARIERLVRTERSNIVSDIHDEIAEAVGPVRDAVARVSVDVADAFTRLANKLAPKLTDAEKAEFAALSQSLLDLDATANAAGVDEAPDAPVDEGGQPVDEPAA